MVGVNLSGYMAAVGEGATFRCLFKTKTPKVAVTAELEGSENCKTSDKVAKLAIVSSISSLLFAFIIHELKHQTIVHYGIWGFINHTDGNTIARIQQLPYVCSADQFKYANKP